MSFKLTWRLLEKNKNVKGEQVAFFGTEISPLRHKLHVYTPVLCKITSKDTKKIMGVVRLGVEAKCKTHRL